MKKTNYLFKSAIVIAAVTIFTACNKEIDRPVSNSNSSYSTASTPQFVNTIAATKGSRGYTGGTGTSDSTKVGTTP